MMSHTKKICFKTLPLLLMVLFFDSAGFAGENNQPIQIGDEPQLFLDDFLIIRTDNITRRVNQAQKYSAGPVLTPDKPWEGNIALIFGSAIYDREDHLFKMWYYCDGGHVGYAISHDGVSWQKPELDVVIRDGHKTNLVVERGKLGYFYEIFGVLKDQHDADPKRRYKLGFVSIEKDYAGPDEGLYHKGQRRGLGVAVSADGIHWRLEDDFASYAICDISRFFWDSKINRYVLFGRTKLTAENNDGRWQPWGWGRAVTRIQSKDFLHWSDEELVLAADKDDPEGAEIYSMSVFPYGDIYIGCVQMFYGLPTQGNLDIQLAVSRDGKTFERVRPRQPFIPEGDVGDWDRFNISLGNLPPIEVDDEMWFYYSSRSYRHGPYDGRDTGPRFGAIGLAKIKRGRFVSVEASFDGGTILTKPLRFEGEHLLINANAKYGTINIQVLDGDENPLPELQAEISRVDDVQIPVPFPQKLSKRTVRLLFTLKNAQLFGFQIRP